MQALGGTNYDLSGVVNADVRAAGTLRNLQGGGKVQINK